MRGQFGFVAVVSPSPDPVSLAIDGVVVFLSVLNAFQARKRARQSQENEVVQAQERLKSLMASVVTAQYDPRSTADQLLVLKQKLLDAGAQFLEYAKQFSIAGPGAIKTIFGVNVNGEWVPDIANNVGVLTQVLHDLDKTIKERQQVAQPQLGFDWDRLEKDLLGIGAAIASKVTGKPVTTTGGTTGGATLPPWVVPAGLALVAVMVSNMRSSRAEN